MSRRTVPPIDASDLHDHADEERVRRIWDRLDHSLTRVTVAEPSPRPRRLIAALLAACLSAFGGGVLVGKVVSRRSAGPVAMPSGAVDQPVSDVLAAGSQSRSFALPGGGEISLLPGATVEIVRGDGIALTLRLVQGEATIDTGPRTSGLALDAGDARVASAAGSMLRVARGSNHLNVDVKVGSASFVAADGSKGDLIAGQGVEGVPLHFVTSAITSPVAPKRVAVAPPPPSVSSGQPDAPAIAAASTSDWRAAWADGKAAPEETLKILRAQPGGIQAALQAAKTPQDLSALSVVLRSRGGDANAAKEALERLLSAFPATPQAALAAWDLAEIYEKSGKLDKAQGYRERYQQISKGLPLDADVLCKKLQAASRAGRNDEAAALAKNYVAKYPEGACREDADRVLRGENLGSDEVDPNGGDTSAPDGSAPRTP